MFFNNKCFLQQQAYGIFRKYNMYLGIFKKTFRYAVSEAMKKYNTIVQMCKA